MRVTMLGPPGSGKGTQGEVLASALGVPQLVSSELLRQATADAPGAGDAQRRMAGGDLVDDDAVIDVVLHRLGQPDARSGFVLDGFPRNTAQASALDDWLRDRQQEIGAAILLEVPREVLIDRLASRAADQDRDDDDPGTRDHRLDVYETEVAPLVEHYERLGVLRRVDGDGDERRVEQRVRAAVAGGVEH